MRTEEEEREKEKEEERKGKKRKKWETKSFFFFVFVFVFLKSTCTFFHMRSCHLFVSRLSRSYPLLFAITISMMSQFGSNMHSYHYFGNFFKYLWPFKDIWIPHGKIAEAYFFLNYLPL